VTGIVGLLQDQVVLCCLPQDGHSFPMVTSPLYVASCQTSSRTVMQSVPCAVVAPGESCSTPLVFTEDNICKYTESLYKGFKLYFDFDEVQSFRNNNDRCKEPSLDGVMRQSHEIGAQHCGDGHCFQRERWPEVSETYMPPWHISCDKSLSGDDGNGTYRQSSLKADYKNRRKKRGRSWTGELQPACLFYNMAKLRVKCKLLFSCDAQGCFLHCGLGCGSHNGHTTPSRKFAGQYTKKCASAVRNRNHEVSRWSPR